MDYQKLITPRYLPILSIGFGILNLLGHILGRTLCKHIFHRTITIDMREIIVNSLIGIPIGITLCVGLLELLYVYTALGKYKFHKDVSSFMLIISFVFGITLIGPLLGLLISSLMDNWGIMQ